jgi:hypothetical protein
VPSSLFRRTQIFLFFRQLRRTNRRSRHLVILCLRGPYRGKRAQGRGASPRASKPILSSHVRRYPLRAMIPTLLRPACNGFCHGLHRHHSSPMVAAIMNHHLQLQQQQSQLSTKTSPPSSSNVTNDEPPIDTSSTIIQGPSLLTSTGVHRPSPSLFHLPGLRSLPFWTAANSSSSSSSSTSGSTSGASSKQHRIAFNDPFVTAAVAHLESNYHDIRSEYFAAVLGNSDQITLNENDIKRRPLEPDYDVSSRGGEHATDALLSSMCIKIFRYCLVSFERDSKDSF